MKIEQVTGTGVQGTSVQLNNAELVVLADTWAMLAHPAVEKTAELEKLERTHIHRKKSDRDVFVDIDREAMMRMDVLMKKIIGDTKNLKEIHDAMFDVKPEDEMVIHEN